MTIGDFSRATHLSVKTLRHYHSVGLLAPSDVDAGTGYRLYTTDQIPTAQVIRRFRDLDMPLDQIHAVLEAPDLRTRNELISAHLASLEQNLARTQSAVASLRDLLAHPLAVAPVSHRRVGATTAAAVTAVIAMSDLLPWYLGALGELHATLDALGVRPSGPAGGTYAGELFADERGEATVFVPTATEIQRFGRVEPVVVRPPSSRSSFTPAHSPTSIGPTEHWPPTWQATRCRWTARSGSITSSAARTPPTIARGGPRSAGQSSAPGRPPEPAAARWGRRLGRITAGRPRQDQEGRASPPRDHRRQRARASTMDRCHSRECTRSRSKAQAYQRWPFDPRPADRTSHDRLSFSSVFTACEQVSVLPPARASGEVRGDPQHVRLAAGFQVLPQVRAGP